MFTEIAFGPAIEAAAAEGAEMGYRRDRLAKMALGGWLNDVPFP